MSNQDVVHIISLGAGVQSSTMLLMACRGEIEPKPKYAVFSDTGWEPKHVYDYLDWLQGEAEKYGIEVIRTSRGNIRDDVMNTVNHGTRSASVPFFTLNADGSKGMVRRQCTSEYKILPVRKAIRQILGYQPRQTPKEKILLWMGISTDEIQRVKPSQVKFIENKYPLIDLGMSRQDCLDWMERRGYPMPPKSSCIGCPYHNNVMWLDMKKHDPVSWADAVEFDNEIRKLPTIKGQAFLHRSCVPLSEVDLGEDDGQIDMFNNECEGMCGV